MNRVFIWAAQMRANFLILSILLVFVGLSTVYKYHTGLEAFNWLHAILITIGVVLAHVSVNLFNEYSDYNTKIDFNVSRTPFSGGSGMLVTGKTKPKVVLAAAILSLIIAFSIGIYFAFVSHWIILAISLFGLLTIIFYTTFFARFMLGELFSGIALGSLVVIGAYIATTANPGMPVSELIPLPVILISIPPGILTSLLLLLNEFPDVEADKAGGRYNIVIHFGRKVSAWIYAAGIFVTFLVIALIPILGFSGPWLFIALITLPLAIKAMATAILHYQNQKKIVSAMGVNVIIVLATNFLIALGILFV